MTHCSADYQASSHTGLSTCGSLHQSLVGLAGPGLALDTNFQFLLLKLHFAFGHLKGHSELEVYFNVYVNIKKLRFFFMAEAES